jgi:hypothetical protein
VRDAEYKNGNEHGFFRESYLGINIRGFMHNGQNHGVIQTKALNFESSIEIFEKGALRKEFNKQERIEYSSGVKDYTSLF